MHNNTNNSDRMNTVAYKIGQVNYESKNNS